ncbi:MAG: histidine--tRNA ligase, partial [Candidatus Acidiferrales bacterium]
MAERKQFRAIKGTRDILPPDSALWNWFEQTARETFGSYGFGEIRLPIFEETELFARSIGAETDVVSKEMFSFFDPFDPAKISEYILAKETSNLPKLTAAEGITLPKDHVPGFVALAVTFDRLTLRPEATASAVRAYIERGMHTRPGNVKLYYMGPMFRRERPQKGRYRQFYQIGAEVLGQSDAPAIDAELIEMLLTFFRRVSLTSTTLYINSIGDKNCRPQYVELLREELRKVKDQLGPDSQRRIETNPLRVLDSKLPEEQPIIEKLPRIGDHLCAECRDHFAKVKEELNLRGIQYEENWRLVRGLDYYTRTTFEVTAA